MSTKLHCTGALPICPSVHIIQRHFRSHSECLVPVQQAIAHFFSCATDSHDRRPVSKQPRRVQPSCQTAHWLDDAPDSQLAYGDHGSEPV